MKERLQTVPHNYREHIVVYIKPEKTKKRSAERLGMKVPQIRKAIKFTHKCYWFLPTSSLNLPRGSERKGIWEESQE